MTDEYVGLQKPIHDYAKKSLLYCQMELLTVLGRYSKYKQIKKHETALRILLKNTVLELKEILRDLDRDLPEIKEDIFRPASLTKEKQKRDELEEEIAEIKRKIAELSE